MINEVIVVSVTAFSGTTDTDKNGKNPVMLQCIAGRMPNRNVMAGTVAENIGIEVGKTYLLQVREVGTDEDFGRTFNWVKIQELTSGLDIVKSIKELGAPEIIVIDKPDLAGRYERKTNAVEGIVTRRIKEGHFKPAIPKTSTDHRTAPEVIEGSSNEALNNLVESKDDIKVDKKK